MFSTSETFLYNDKNNEWATQRGIDIFETSNAFVCCPSRMSAVSVNWGNSALLEE
jgi:hypothetical protein